MRQIYIRYKEPSFSLIEGTWVERGGGGGGGLETAGLRSKDVQGWEMGGGGRVVVQTLRSALHNMNKSSKQFPRIAYLESKKPKRSDKLTALRALPVYLVFEDE